ncbi:hypothetical protein Nmel_015008 [Mimus melanotis]
MDMVPCQSIPRDLPLPDTDWGHRGWLRVGQAATTTIGSSPWGWQVQDAELQMSHQLHERKPELIASRFECPLLPSGTTESHLMLQGPSCQQRYRAGKQQGRGDRRWCWG